MSGRYRRRPVEVEAWQNDDAGPAMPDWLKRISQRGRGGIVTFTISDKIGICQLGDFVVLHPSGTIAVMDPGDFGREFEEVAG